MASVVLGKFVIQKVFFLRRVYVWKVYYQPTTGGGDDRLEKFIAQNFLPPEKFMDGCHSPRKVYLPKTFLKFQTKKFTKIDGTAPQENVVQENWLQIFLVGAIGASYWSSAGHLCSWKVDHH